MNVTPLVIDILIAVIVAGVVVIAHMEVLCRILAEQTDICCVHAVADRQSTARALRVRQVFMGHASAEFNVT